MRAFSAKVVLGLSAATLPWVSALAGEDATFKLAVENLKPQLAKTTVFREAPHVREACQEVTTDEGSKACEDLPLVIAMRDLYGAIASYRTPGHLVNNCSMYVRSDERTTGPNDLWVIFLEAADVKPPFVLISQDCAVPGVGPMLSAHEYGHYLLERNQQSGNRFILPAYIGAPVIMTKKFIRTAIKDEYGCNTAYSQSCRRPDLVKTAEDWRKEFSTPEEEFAIMFEAKFHQLQDQKANADDFICERFHGRGERQRLLDRGVSLGDCPDGHPLVLQKFFRTLWDRAKKDTAAYNP